MTGEYDVPRCRPSHAAISEPQLAAPLTERLIVRQRRVRAQIGIDTRDDDRYSVGEHSAGKRVADRRCLDRDVQRASLPAVSVPPLRGFSRRRWYLGTEHGGGLRPLGGAAQRRAARHQAKARKGRRQNTAVLLPFCD